MDVHMTIAVKRCEDGSFDAEIAVMFYAFDGSILQSTGQRTVQTGFKNREAATASVKAWIDSHILPIIEQLPTAKP